MQRLCVWIPGTTHIDKSVYESMKGLQFSMSLGSCANCCYDPYRVIPFNIAETVCQWQTTFLWFMTVCHSHNLCTFSLALVSVLSAQPTLLSVANSQTHTLIHIFLSVETYSSILLLRQVHYKHRLLGNTQTERNFCGKLKLFGLV